MLVEFKDKGRAIFKGKLIQLQQGKTFAKQNTKKVQNVTLSNSTMFKIDTTSLQLSVIMYAQILKQTACFHVFYIHVTLKTS